jgi:glycosyltransferase involved in cell wall biosynthesis
LLEEKTNITTGRVQGIILCPQHLPKFHPSFDEVLLGALVRYPESVVVTIGLEKKYQWRRTLTQRWRNYLAEVYRLAHRNSESSMGDADEVLFIDNVIARIRWLPSLSPSEYLLLLSVGDVMVDPFPFGGGVTTLESLAVCTPVVTYPSRQTVPELAAGMLRKLALPSSVSAALIVNSVEEYIESIGLLLAERRLQETGNMREESGNSTDITSVYIRRELCNRVSHLYEQQDASKEWGNFFVNAFNFAN